MLEGQEVKAAAVVVSRVRWALLHALLALKRGRVCARAHRKLRLLHTVTLAGYRIRALSTHCAHGGRRDTFTPVLHTMYARAMEEESSSGRVVSNKKKGSPGHWYHKVLVSQELFSRLCNFTASVGRMMVA